MIGFCCEACARGLPCEGSTPRATSELGDASYSSTSSPETVPRQTAIAYSVMTMGVGMAIGGMLALALMPKKSR